MEDIHDGTVVKFAWWFDIDNDPIGNITSIEQLRSKFDQMDYVGTYTVGSGPSSTYILFNDPENGITFADFIHPQEIPKYLIVFIESQPNH